MRALARDLSVSAPSLYFHVESREDLLSQLIGMGLQEFGAMMRGAADAPGTPRDRVRELADAYIAFAEANPQLFGLIFGPCVDDARYPTRAADEAAVPVRAVAAEIVGEERAMFLAEGLWALAHGYTMLRLADQFRLNPDHRAGFDLALALLLDGARLAAPSPAH